MLTFTDHELRAYIAEELPVARSAALEKQLTVDGVLKDRLRGMLADSDSASLAVREVWTGGRLSCPSRTTWSEFLAGTLGDGLRQYMQFHLEEVGCRLCAANIADLQEQGGQAADQRRRKFFETSVGRLREVPTTSQLVSGE